MYQNRQVDKVLILPVKFDENMIRYARLGSLIDDTLGTLCVIPITRMCNITSGTCKTTYTKQVATCAHVPPTPDECNKLALEPLQKPPACSPHPRIIPILEARTRFGFNISTPDLKAVYT